MKRRILAALSLFASLLPAASGCGHNCGDRSCSDSESCQLGVVVDDDGRCQEQVGRCVARPLTCPVAEEPVCGWDGVVYRSECAARAARVAPVALTFDVPCPESATPSGFIPCQGIYCDPLHTYCEVTWGDTCDGWTRCAPFPANCASAPTCECLDAELQIGSHTCEDAQGNGVKGLRIDGSAV